MRFLWRWLKRAILALVVVVLLLLAPVGYTELACRGPVINSPATSLIGDDFRRAESATFLTYPEWHIVFAYDDYAKVLETGDPDDFAYFRAIRGFWSSLCGLTETADAHGGGGSDVKAMVYTIGVSFTAELAAKAAYEETIGRLFTLLRGADPAPSDRASAKMAQNYAAFLHQIPWYKYDFPSDVAELNGLTGATSWRDAERRFALGTEFGVKTAYAKVIAKAVAATGQADLTIRSVVDFDGLASIKGVEIIGQVDQGTIIETPRYALFTDILKAIVLQGGEIVEIAGNDEIMVTVISPSDTLPASLQGYRVLASLPRQGYGDMRWLITLPLNQLGQFIRLTEKTDVTLEHIFDY